MRYSGSYIFGDIKFSMADYGIPVEDVEKYQKWTGYLLVDIKIIFIITYVYISVVNLISTTANNEANRDVQAGTVRFNVTARPGDTDVAVDYIDDSVLWNCREHSLTSDYYVTLYWMLLSVFMGTLVFYAASKFFALWSITSSDSLTDLWHIGVMKHLKKSMKKATYSSDDAVQLAKCYRNLLSKEIPEDVSSEVKKLSIVKRRKSIPYLSLMLLVSVLVFGALSYDLHPLSCINGISEKSINYNNMTQTVELKFAGSVIVYQQVSVFITFLLLIALFVFAGKFYQLTRKLVDIMEAKVESKTKETSLL